jgi:phosphate transport system permease protein
VEAAKPMVYVTTLVLILVVVTLNLTGILLRNRMRRKYAGSAV